MMNRMFALLLESAAWFGVPLGLTMAVVPFLPGHEASLVRVSEILGTQQAPWLLEHPSLQTLIILCCIAVPAACLGGAGWFLRRQIARNAAPIAADAIPIWPLRATGGCLATIAAFSAFWGLLAMATLLYFGRVPILDQEVEASALVTAMAFTLGGALGGARLGFGLFSLAGIAHREDQR